MLFQYDNFTERYDDITMRIKLPTLSQAILFHGLNNITQSKSLKTMQCVIFRKIRDDLTYASNKYIHKYVQRDYVMTGLNTG